MKVLDFEKPIEELYAKIDELKRLSADSEIDMADEISKIEQRALQMKKEIFSNLSPTQIIQISRHQNRPSTLGLARLIADDFIELHGDRVFGDDPAIVGGPALVDGRRVMIIGHQKGMDTKDNIYRNFGMPNPEGYRKALRLMQMAETFNMPIVTFIDTPGAYPGLGAEERGQAEAIARNLREMAGLTVPVISYVVGEGGSGGALGIAVSNRVYMMEYSVYSVISPEGAASILYRDAKQADIAAKNMRITARDVVELGLADGIITEPLGGAHQDWPATAEEIKKSINATLKTYDAMSADDIRDERYNKFRSFGKFDTADPKSAR